MSATGMPLPQPCKECVFRRAAEAGSLLPDQYEGALRLVHGRGIFSCHMAMERQCRGAAIYRANIGKTKVRDPATALGPVDHERVFSSADEFRRHHA